MKATATLAAIVFGLLFVSEAVAAPPLLGNVTHDKRHPWASVAAPRASSVTMYMATRPDRATDGSFLTENVKEIDFLTDQETQTKTWLYESALAPGTWYLMLRATAESSCYSYPPPDYKEVIDPACAHGFSTVNTLTIPKPTPRYTAKVDALRSIGIVYLTLRAAPLGESRGYRVCWRLKTRKRVCVRGTLDGYDWDSAATDFLRVNARGMARTTTFTWQVGGRAVAQKRVRTR